ncbi:protein kinase [bacterium]|nr:protein kinase [bacterium]
MPILPGRKLGPYKVTGQLGTGGMGEVYVATDTRLDRRVAVKVLPPHLSEDSQFSRRFQQEARTIASLNHPHICMLLDIGNDAGVDYLVMEYLEGETLRSRLRTGPMTVQDAWTVALQIANGLAAAHNKGIIHRDLKPENIFLTGEHGAKILDFGLAARVQTAETVDNPSSVYTQDKITSPGTVLGTLEYLSPEQACGQPPDARSDLFAFGLILYEMITGRSCFSRRTAAETLAAILRDDPKEFTSQSVAIPFEIQSLVRQCLRKNPEDRPQSANEVVSNLRKIGQSGDTVSFSGPEEVASIAVLPFRNLGMDRENEYFSDGLTEELIADLSKISSLRVISRISAMRLKDSQKDVKDISKVLNVRYILEGSVRKAGVNLRITAQLTDTDSDSVLWSDKYGGTLEDVFEIQERVSRSIVDALSVRLTAKENRLLAERPFENIQAYDAYLRARNRIWTFDESQLNQAVSELKSALALSGDNIILYRGIGVAMWQYLNMGASADPAYLDEAEDYARKILRLDPSGPHGPALLGLIAAHRGNIQEWIRQLQISVRIDPTDTDCLSMLALGWLFVGQMKEAFQLIARIESVDPLWFFLYWLKAFYDYLECRFDSALSYMKKSKELQPINPAVSWATAQILASMDKKEEAVTLIEQTFPNPSESAFATMAWMLKYALRAQPKPVEELMTPEFESAVWSDLQWTHAIAQCYALLDNKEQSLRWLERSASRGFIHYPFLSQRDPLLKNVRADSSFQALMRKTKQQWQNFTQMN